MKTLKVALPSGRGRGAIVTILLLPVFGIDGGDNPCKMECGRRGNLVDCASARPSGDGMATRIPAKTADAASGQSPDQAIMVTRLAPAMQRAKLLERGDLLKALDAASSARLISLEAAAGYGKTTLLSQWRDKLLAGGVTVAWLSLDEEDDSAGALVANLGYAFQRAGITVPPEVIAAFAPHEADARHRLQRLLNAIAVHGRPLALILDEFERLSPAVVHAVIAPLIKWAPDNLTTAIAGRERLPLPVAALRARGLVFELKAVDLRFRPDEIGRLFDCQLSRADLSSVEANTEGWPVAVQLLKSWWAGNKNQHQALTDLQGASSDIAEYLSEQVLSFVPEALRLHLREVSVLDTLSDGAIEFITGRAGLLSQILAVDVLRPFLTSVDQDVGAYRLHPILQAVLAGEFSLLPAERRMRLHKTAAQWYAKGGQLTRAVRHALDGGDLDLAGNIVEAAGGVQIWIRQGMARTKAVDAYLSEPLLDRFPRLRLLRALVLAKEGRLSVARQNFEKARATTQDFTVLAYGGDLATLRQDSLVVESTLLVNECQPPGDAYLAAFEDTLRGVAGDDHICQGYWRTFLCISRHQRGLFDKATEAAHEAIDHYRQFQLPHGEFFNHLHIGAINFAQGMPTAAAAAYERARHMAATQFPDDQTKATLINALQAELAYEQNLILKAHRRAQLAISRTRKSEAWYDIYAAEFITAIMIALEREGLDAAAALIDTARLEASARQARGLMPLLEATRASCLALSGLAGEAADVLRYSPLDLAELAEWQAERTWREREAIMVAFIRVAARNPSFAIPVDRLEQSLRRLWALRHVRSAIRISVALAVYYAARGDIAAAFQHLAAAVRSSATTGYIRAFHEEAATVLPLLMQWQAAAGSAMDREVKHHAKSLLASLSLTRADDAHLPALTAREADMLRQLNSGLSDKEIARALDLSQNTVKFHLKNLYLKLHAANRLEAVQKGRDLGLIT